MATKRTRPSKPHGASPEQGRTAAEHRTPALPAFSDPGQPGGGQGRSDPIPRIPEDVHVDPEITEDHPGYGETGPSEIRVPREPRNT